MIDGKALRRAVDSKGLKHGYVAEQLGISSVHLSHIFTGRTQPSKPVLKLACIFLGLNEKDIRIDEGKVSNTDNQESKSKRKVS